MEHFLFSKHVLSHLALFSVLLYWLLLTSSNLVYLLFPVAASKYPGLNDRGENILILTLGTSPTLFLFVLCLTNILISGM